MARSWCSGHKLVQVRQERNVSKSRRVRSNWMMSIGVAGQAAVEKLKFYWMNTVFGNLTSALRSSYHSFEPR